MTQQRRRFHQGAEQKSGFVTFGSEVSVGVLLRSRGLQHGFETRAGEESSNFSLRNKRGATVKAAAALSGSR